ncbi:hypothetical protein SAMN05192588_0068 [Nonlabens sp. Hel1_33_55]|uniref:hypothetical protein n=1 Tax=Nonlabens sp. Hel1_33_55 TaxID=1336802 RepID=UPI000875A97C|nr:hypothetical protein [Nonlabens sp. Hel1_33_55]SCX88005.1 hypothetical protein SAMN05192588_0068 [Nonlabens sp. Hel1_33_55]
MNKILFQEEQRFNQWWLWLILGIVFISVAVAIISLREKLTITDMILSIAVTAAIFGSLALFKLTTTITEENIKIHFFPFIKREWKWTELQIAEVIDYGFVGGWGIRIWTGYGTVYNVRGSKGLHIKTDSKEYVIGTQKEQELRDCIAHLLK